MMQQSQVVSTGISRQSVLLIKRGQGHEEENIKPDDRTGIGTWTDYDSSDADHGQGFYDGRSAGSTERHGSSDFGSI